ncbi:MAG: FapA family protein [Spirochaetia bacterium]|nr:FapA family protein [Spirochaetia bacterium]
MIAGCYGRFIHEEGSFGVKEVLEISNNVDYHTGNIDFPGDVIIYGEVKDRFTVQSGGSIFCSSTLDAHDVSCKGDLVVTGGIIGRKDGVVKVGGKIRTNFIENCYVEAEGPIFVKTSVMNSIVNTKGKLTMGKRGTIIGGKIFAQNGVESAQIGTHNQTRTEINCGVDFSIQQKLFWIKDNQIKLLQKKRKVETMLSMHTDDLEKLTQLKDEISGKIRKLSEVSIILLERLDKNDAAYVAVSDTVHSGVYLEICHTSFVVKNPMTKVRFTLNKKMGKIDFKAL